MPKNAEIFICKKCDFTCCKQSNYDFHLLTRKHQMDDAGGQKDYKFTQQNAVDFVCECGKEYSHRQGLYAHKKKCTKDTETKPAPEHSDSDIKLLTNLVLEVVKSHADLQKQMFDVCKNSNSTSNSHNNHTNSHNKTFNLQFFLNEQCKDAMNIMDFVNTFQLQFSDFERIGEVGYVEGISKIIIDKLNEMDIYKRPIHCSDAKREIMYVKDKDVWEKENATNSKIRLAVRHITKKNSDMVRPWLIKHPGALDSDHHLNDNYQAMIIEAMGGNSGTIQECENKIIKKISKMVLIDKKC